MSDVDHDDADEYMSAAEDQTNLGKRPKTEEWSERVVDTRRAANRVWLCKVIFEIWA